MGMCKVSGGISKHYGRNLPKDGTPDSKAELYDEEGNLIQERWYDSDGQVMWNRDWEHGDYKQDPELAKRGVPKFPHDHDWDWEQVPPRTKKHLEVNPMFC